MDTTFCCLTAVKTGKFNFYLNPMTSRFVCEATISSLTNIQTHPEQLRKSGIRSVTFDKTSTAHACSPAEISGASDRLSCQRRIPQADRDDWHDRRQNNFAARGWVLEVVPARLHISNPLVTFSHLTSSGGYKAIQAFLNGQNRCNYPFDTHGAMAFGANWKLYVTEDIAVTEQSRFVMRTLYPPGLSSTDLRLSDTGRPAATATISSLNSAIRPVCAPEADYQGID